MKIFTKTSNWTQSWSQGKSHKSRYYYVNPLEKQFFRRKTIFYKPFFVNHVNNERIAIIPGFFYTNNTN